MPVELRDDAPDAVALVRAIQDGDLAGLRELLRGTPDLANCRIVSTGTRSGKRTPLHIATDYPGHFPRGKETIQELVARGADVNAPFEGAHSERPLHWAASTDDIDAVDALLSAGADIESSGSVIDGGSALSDAVAFAQWKAARRLVERGAATNLWQEAALGLVPRIDRRFQDNQRQPAIEITKAFWCACHGGEIASAQYLLA